MLVKCEQCGAGYDFPVEQLPEDGLRAKCAACGHVMWIRKPGHEDDEDASFDGSIDTPAHAGYSVVHKRPAEVQAPGRALVAASEPPPRVFPPLNDLPADDPDLPAPKPVETIEPRLRADDPDLPAPKPEANPGLPPPGDPNLPAPKPGANRALPPPEDPDLPAPKPRDEPIVRREESADASRGFRLDPADRARREADKPAEPAPEPEPEAPREDVPSMVVDLDHLGTPPPAPKEPEPGPPAPDTSAFTPLTSTPAMPAARPKPAMRDAATMLVAAPEDPGDIRPVKPPSLWQLTLAVFLLSLGAFLGFVSWRNDWRPVWEQPDHSLKVAFGMVREPTVAAPRVRDVVEETPLKGNLEIRGVQIELVQTGKKSRAAVVRGEVHNSSNRRHGHIELRARLFDAPGQPHTRTHRFGCCDTLSPEEATAAAKDPDHAHHQPGTRAIRLDPGQSQPFALVLREVGPRTSHAEVMVHYSEPERNPN